LPLEQTRSLSAILILCKQKSTSLIFESEIILISPPLKISESSSNGSYRNTDEVWWRYGISRSCDKCRFTVTFQFIFTRLTEILETKE
jgi:hypothetical protein